MLRTNLTISSKEKTFFFFFFPFELRFSTLTGSAASVLGILDVEGTGGWGGQQKQEEGHACCINTSLSVNVNLGLTVRKQESKELQWGVQGGEGFFLFFSLWNSTHVFLSGATSLTRLHGSGFCFFAAVCFAWCVIVGIVVPPCDVAAAE